MRKDAMPHFTKSDYASINFTDTETEYFIGVENGTKFISEDTTFYATQDCLIQINGDSLWISIPKRTWMFSERRIVQFKVKRTTVNGTLEVWAEGKDTA